MYKVAFAYTLVPGVKNSLFPCCSAHMTISCLCFVCIICSEEASLYWMMLKIYYLLSEKWVRSILVSVRTKNRLYVLGQYRLGCHRLGVCGRRSVRGWRR